MSGDGATMTATINQTNPLSVTETIAGVFHAGDVINTVVGGIPFRYVVKPADTNAAGVATAIAALIDAHPLILASAAGAVITITFTGTANGVVVTSGSTALSLGGSGGTITPTWTGNLTLGDSWSVDVYPVGIKFQSSIEWLDQFSIQ